MIQTNYCIKGCSFVNKYYYYRRECNPEIMGFILYKEEYYLEKMSAIFVEENIAQI